MHEHEKTHEGHILRPEQQYPADYLNTFGVAMAELYDTAKKVAGMTATLINGYSSGIFYLLYQIAPSLMKKDGKDYESPTEFDKEYGVIQTTYEETEPEYNSNRRTVQSRASTRLLPGVSPLVYSRFLIEYAVFLSLSDMGKDLPEYEEIPIPLTTPEAAEKEYERVESVLKDVLKNDQKVAKKILSAYLNLLTAYPDQPYGHKPIYHPIDGHKIVEPADTAAEDGLSGDDLLKAIYDTVQTTHPYDEISKHIGYYGDCEERSLFYTARDNTSQFRRGKEFLRRLLATVAPRAFTSTAV